MNSIPSPQTKLLASKCSMLPAGVNIQTCYPFFHSRACWTPNTVRREKRFCAACKDLNSITESYLWFFFYHIKHIRSQVLNHDACFCPHHKESFLLVIIRCGFNINRQTAVKVKCNLWWLHFSHYEENFLLLVIKSSFYNVKKLNVFTAINFYSPFDVWANWFLTTSCLVYTFA